MGEFRLQVGDVIELKTRSLEVLPLAREDGYNVCHLHKRDANFAISNGVFKTFLDQGAKVHRPTPSGLVQVWPEVEGK